MTGLNHVATGAAIALVVREPLLVMPLALLSHFVLDAIPHFDHELYRYGSKYFVRIMAADTLISIGVIVAIMALVPQLAGVVLLGALFAILPDFFWLYYYTRGRPQWWFFRFHNKIQWFERPIGVFVEASYAVFIALTVIAAAIA